VTVGKSRYTVRQRDFTDLAIGDSVAVDGVCLTVMEVLPQDLSLPHLQKLSAVQLWDSCRWTMVCQLRNVVGVGSKLGGHFVMGHVDGIVICKLCSKTATSWEMSYFA